jgi:hypothetical protein
MVWRYFDRKVQISKRNEFLIWTETVALPFKFSSPNRIATFFIKKGFDTKLLTKQGMSGKAKMLLECCQTDPAERKLFLDFFKKHNEILERYIAPAIVNRDPTMLDIRRALSNHSPVIALVDSYYTSKARGAKDPPHLPHWIVIRGYEGEKFHVNDSNRESGLETGKTVMKGRILEKVMNTYSRFGWPSALIVVGLRKAN